jgi:uncharacterized coiled-coil DUF342 family protein
MNTGEFKASISQMASDLTSSRKQLHEKLAKLKSDFKELQKCIVEKNEQIAQLKNQRNDLISLLDQAFAIIDDPSQNKLFDDLSTVEGEVKALIGIAKAEERAEKSPAGAAVKNEPGEQAKKWAKDVLKGVGDAAGRGSAAPSKA